MYEEDSNREKVCLKIQELLIKKSSNFKQIVENCDVEKGIVSKYLDELIIKGNVVLKRKRKQGIEKYGLSKKGKENITILLEKQKIIKQINQMAPEKFQEFKKFLDFVINSKKEDEFFFKFPDKNDYGTIFRNVGKKILNNVKS
ncbi:hypothetical protein KJN74_04440 [Candidatus Bathyarchaeota archaeon]|nr:hypothetical protein [Candidatus Bathyarchaeota archaeon]